MSDLSQEYSNDEDIISYKHNSDGFATQSQEEYDDHSREVHIDINGYNHD